MKKLVSVLLCSSLVSFSALGAELSVSVNSGEYVAIGGNEFAGDSIMITVVPEGSIYSEDTDYAVIKEAITRDGIFELDFKMPKSSDSGYYEASAYSDEDGEHKKVFFFCNPQKSKSFFDYLNGRDITYSDLKSNADVLGIKTDIDSGKIAPELLVGYINNLRGKNALDANSFTYCYFGALLMGAKDYDYEEFSDILIVNAEMLGCEKHLYFSYDEEKRSRIFDCIKDMTFNTENFSDALTEASLINALSDAATKDAFKKVVFDEFDFYLELDTSDYDELKSPENVIMALMSKTFSSVDDLKSTFYKEVKKQADSEKPKKSTGGGSSSSGSFPKASYENESSDKTTSQPVPDLPLVNASIFDDVESHWAKDAIMYLKDKAVVDGVGDNMFLPEKDVTRAEFAKMIVRAFSLTASDEKTDFADVSRSDWFFEDVEILSSNGIINGRGDGTFAPYDSITRQDAALIMKRVADVCAISVTESEKEFGFDDAESIADYALEAVITLYKAGFINGVSNQLFEPGSFVTRAQASQMIYNMIAE